VAFYSQDYNFYKMMLKSIESQYWTLKFADAELEIAYQELKFKDLRTRSVVLSLGAINVIILIFMLIHLVQFATEDEQFMKHLTTLIVFLVTLLAEAALIIIPCTRCFRGFLYINGLSYIFASQLGGDAFDQM